MPLKKVDSRIRTLIENSVTLGHRCLFVVVGDHGRDQVVILHHMMSKATVKGRPSVLWCYKKELGFSRKKRMKQLQKKIKSGTLEVKNDDPFELFIAATNIRYCYYSETHKILGSTYGMCILQDFEALTPNLLARTVETVEGGGIVVMLLRTVDSLRQLCTMTMDIHARYRTEAHQHVIARFNERFILSLADCTQCIVMDDQLNILPISSHMLSLTPLLPKAEDEEPVKELKALKESLADVQPVGHLVRCCKTLDQAKTLLKIVEAISEQTLRSTVAMTAARGRGKSATLGLSLAAAVAFGYANIFVTSPSPENLQTLFAFVLKGFDSIEYVEHEHYEVIQSTNPEFNRATVRINVFQQHRQTIQYIHPADAHKLEQAELLCIDEAAAIPLPLVKRLLGPYLVFMASTVNGYEGTGRSLSLKLMEDLRRQSGCGTGGRTFREVSLEEPIRYASHDPVEAWLHQLLCLNAGSVALGAAGGCPDPGDCNLYHVNRDTLFCYHKASEAFLQRIMALYVSSHYKNSPNDLQLLSDAPAHQIFVLLGPLSEDSVALPQVLCVLQVCLEGAISRKAVMKSLSQGKRASGDLIPWTLAQQFADHNFAGLSGARIVRIATHPDFQRMGYGTRAIKLLMDYYSGKMQGLHDQAAEATAPSEESPDEPGTPGLLHEVIAPKKSLPPLLSELASRTPEPLDYVGVAFGLTAELLRFWCQKNSFVPLYLRQTQNELTGEHSCIMLAPLLDSCQWLSLYYNDFRSRYLSLLGYQFRFFSPKLALGLLQAVPSGATDSKPLTYDDMMATFSKYDIKRLELYSRNMADHHLITDMLPALARLYFTHKTDFKLMPLQAAILLGVGLQYKTIDDLQSELDLSASQLLGLFNRIMRMFAKAFKALEEGKTAADLSQPSSSSPLLKPIPEPMEKELLSVAKELKSKQFKARQELLQNHSLTEHAVSEAWTTGEALQGQGQGQVPSIISVERKKSGKRKAVQETRATKGHKKRRK